MQFCRIYPSMSSDRDGGKRWTQDENIQETLAKVGMMVGFIGVKIKILADWQLKWLDIIHPQRMTVTKK